MDVLVLAIVLLLCLDMYLHIDMLVVMSSFFHCKIIRFVVTFCI